MNTGPHDSTPLRPWSVTVRPRNRTIFLLLLAATALGFASVEMGTRFARSAVVDIGPTDAHYVSGFREIERDGDVYFRWTALRASTLTFPLHICGPGELRLRVRRHFVDPAILTVSLNGRRLGQASVQAGGLEPYSVINFPFAPMACDSNASVLLESEVQNQRDLGVAIDWVEVRSVRGLVSSEGSRWRGSIGMFLVGCLFLAAGAAHRLIASILVFLAVSLAGLFSVDPISAERILRGGGVALILAAAVSVVFRQAARTLTPRGRVALLSISLLALVSRSAFLHQQTFYPDYRVHALVQQTFDKDGLTRFLGQLFEVQYARSLGLQQIDGRWYPFPYPPGSYILAGGVGHLFSLDPMDALMASSIASATLIPLLALVLGLALGVGEGTALIAALFTSIHPLLVRRLALGYFPSLVGGTLDLIALWVCIRVLNDRRMNSRMAIGMVAILAIAFLVYTQSIANFGLFVSGLIAVTILRRQSLAGPMRLATLSAFALLGAFGLFYWRYVAVVDNIAARRPQPEARVLDRLDDLRRAHTLDELAGDDDSNDPYAGSTLNPVRGLARLSQRLWMFNGPFLIALVAGAILLLRRLEGVNCSLALAWAGVSLWISLLASGLPSPNGFQHLKDLEFTVPLAGLAFGETTVRLWRWKPWLAGALGLAWLGYAGYRWNVELSDRLLRLAGL